MRRFLFSGVINHRQLRIADHIVSGTVLWRDRAESDDCTDGILWIYEREESRTSDRIFQWSAM